MCVVQRWSAGPSGSEKGAGFRFMGGLDTTEERRERALSKVDKLYVSPATWLVPGIGPDS